MSEELSEKRMGSSTEWEMYPEKDPSKSVNFKTLGRDLRAKEYFETMSVEMKLWEQPESRRAENTMSGMFGTEMDAIKCWGKVPERFEEEAPAARAITTCSSRLRSRSCWTPGE